MDFYVIAIIVVVFVASCLSLLVIYSKGHFGGKTFEQIQLERKLAAEQILSNFRQKKSNNKKVTKKTSNKERRQQQHQKDRANKIVSSEQNDNSEDQSDQSSQAHVTGSNEKLEVNFDSSDNEWATTEVISMKKPKRNRKNDGGITKYKSSSILLNKSDAIPPVEPATNEQVNLNHFAETHPKDDFEIKRQKEEAAAVVIKKENKKGRPKRDANTSPKISNSGESASGTSSPSSSNVATVLVNDIEIEIPVLSAIEKEPLNQQQQQQQQVKGSPKTIANKEKTNKKKKIEQVSVQYYPAMNPADVGVNSIISLLGKAELTRSEIQLLIDYLLNKQQDTVSVNHSDWSDDIVQKLRKQLADKDKDLQAAAEQTLSIQSKLKEVRKEFNDSRIQNHQAGLVHAEETGRLKLEINGFQQEIQFITDKHLNEKQTMVQQIQMLQQKLMQEKQAQTAATDNLQKIQELTDTNETLTGDNLSKQQIINDLNNFLNEKHLITVENAKQLDELNEKINDYDKMLMEKDERTKYLELEINELKQHLSNAETDMNARSNEHQRLHENVAHLHKEHEKIQSLQLIEIEQLKSKVTAAVEQNKSNNHLDDASKVEIRNLQNALDSSKTLMGICQDELTEKKQQIEELTTQLNAIKINIEQLNANNSQQNNQIAELTTSVSDYKNQLSEKSAKLNDYEKQLQNLTGKEDELFKQIADHKEKNNDLRTKNWKLIDALSIAENKATKQNNINHNNVGQALNIENVVMQEQIRTKQLLERLFPDLLSSDSSSDNKKWIDNLEIYLKQYINDNERLQQVAKAANAEHQNCAKLNSNNNNNNISNDDAIVDIDNGNDDDDREHVKLTTGTNKKHCENESCGYNELLLENNKLRKAAYDLKAVATDTGKLLFDLEQKVREQDMEINTLKSSSSSNT